MKELFELFYTFALIGVTTFGGGAAMLPILQREIVDKRGWATVEELADYYAIGQCTPGIIAINTSTFIGFKRKGVPGGIVATLGMIFPSLVIITVIAAFLSGFAELEFVRDAFAGIRACVCVLILNAVIKLWKSAVTDTAGIIIFAVAFIVSAFTSLPVAFIVLVAGLAGFIIRKIKRRSEH
ncbi:MAG: chromate transporter [Ruminococcaceae bacterium]|nr:chromate transporter [Oscillospiraceae bacterium]